MICSAPLSKADKMFVCMYVCMIDAKEGKCGCDDRVSCSFRPRGERVCRDMYETHIRSQYRGYVYGAKRGTSKLFGSMDNGPI